MESGSFLTVSNTALCTRAGRSSQTVHGQPWSLGCGETDKSVNLKGRSNPGSGLDVFQAQHSAGGRTHRTGTAHAVREEAQVHGHQNYGRIAGQRGLGRRAVAVDPPAGRPRGLGANSRRGADRSSVQNRRQGSRRATTGRA